MKEIKFTREKVAVVDDDDFDFLSTWKWHTVKPKQSQHLYYASRGVTIEGKQTQVLMHRVIMGLGKGRIPEIDHKDGDGLNNVKANLRIVTHIQNLANCRIAKNNSSGFKGVYFYKRKGKWRAQCSIKGKTVDIGDFKNPIEAAKAYDRKAKELYGEFACLNFPE